MDNLFNLEPATVNYLMGAITTLIGAAANHIFTTWRANKEEEKRAKAISVLFAGIVNSYANCNDPLCWCNKLWDKYQIEIALYFPEESYNFANIINGTKSSFESTYASASQIEARQLSKTIYSHNK